MVLLSDGFWKRRFGSDPHVVGRRLRIDGAIATIVGVLDGSVDTSIFNIAADVWIPLQLDPNSTDHPPSLIAAARLRPGATMALAQARARLAGNEFRRRFPEVSGSQDTFTIAPFQDALVQDIRPSFLVLVGAEAFVLLISCANVANLILIRGSVRQQEIAIRTAIGASRWQIVRQLATESLMQAFVGGSLGLAFGEAGVRALLALNPADLPRIGPDAAGATIDWRVALFTFAISAITGLVCGVWPAMRVATGDERIRVGSEGRSGATARERHGAPLVASDVSAGNRSPVRRLSPTVYRYQRWLSRYGGSPRQAMDTSHEQTTERHGFPVSPESRLRDERSLDSGAHDRPAVCPFEIS